MKLAVATLYTNGAREVIVGNLSNLGSIPLFSSYSTTWRSYVNSKVAIFNSELVSAMTNAMQQNPGLRIYLLDDNTALNNIMSAPATFGFTVATNGALEDSNLADKSFTGPGANYVFWDYVHPTTKLHALTAAGAFASVAVQMNLARSGSHFSLAAGNLYPGLPYTIQSSANFLTWTNYEPFTATTTNFTVSVTNTSSRPVFYRMSY